MTEPRLRFKADDGNEFPDWNGENVGNLTMELEDYEKLSSGYPLLTSSRAGIMLQSDFRDKITTDNDATVFSVVPYGKCTYRHMSDDDIFHFNINDIAENGLVSREYPVFDTVNGNSLYLLVEYLNSNRRFRKFCREMKKGGTRTRLYYKHLCEFQLFFPSLPEQQKIADFLSSIDEIIKTTEAELKVWQERKKGVMQKIFNREVRFKADDGSEFPEWEEKKLGEVVDVLDSQRVPVAKVDRRPGKYPYYGSTAIQDYIDTFLFDEPLVLLAEDAGPFNDFVNQPIAQFATGKFWVNNHAHVLRPHQNRKFLFYALVHKDIRKFINNPARGKLNQDEMINILVGIPSFPEQKKIADCLSSLDDVISQIQAELLAWKEFKKGLLQQMFV